MGSSPQYFLPIPRRPAPNSVPPLWMGLFRNFDDVLIARKCPEHIGFEMFYLGKANGYPPRPFAGAPARAVRTPAGAGGTNKQPDFDRCEGSTPKRRLSELSSTFPQNS